LLQRYEHDDVDLERDYPVTFVDIKSLGYAGSGDLIRGFDFDAFLASIEVGIFDTARGSPREGGRWRAFDVNTALIKKGEAYRFDLKYWEPETLAIVSQLKQRGARPIGELNTVKTHRGKSPKAESYVDEKDGYALVVKAGSNITQFGELLVEGDFIEKNVYDEMESVHLKGGDVLLSSTGTGTLGKACVFESNSPAIADGHVSIIRVNPDQISPHYLSDYLRVGLGAIQIERLYTGSTGLIELQPEEVDQILIDVPPTIAEQELASSKLRRAEQDYRLALKGAQARLVEARENFSLTKDRE
jgi:type I restriction enzyme M protein